MGDVIKIVRFNGGNLVPVVCLCGSTKYKDDFLRIASALTIGGKIVLMPGVFAHTDGIDINEATKKNLDELHKRKIDLADEIFVINKDGYIGDSTKSEIAYARAHLKPIRFMETSDE